MNDQRENMLFSQLIARGVSSDIVQAFSSIDREDFVPIQFKRSAYPDIELSLQNNKVMLRCFVMARIIENLLSCSRDSVLLIGDSSGYTATLFNNFFKTCVIGTFENSEINALRKKLTSVKVSFIDDIKNKFDVIFFDGGIYKKSTIKVASKLLNNNGNLIYISRKITPEFSEKQFDFFNASINMENNSKIKTIIEIPLFLASGVIA